MCLSEHQVEQLTFNKNWHLWSLSLLAVACQKAELEGDFESLQISAALRDIPLYFRTQEPKPLYHPNKSVHKAWLILSPLTALGYEGKRKRP